MAILRLNPNSFNSVQVRLFAPLFLLGTLLLTPSPAVADPTFAIHVHLGWSFSCADFFLNAPSSKVLTLRQSGEIKMATITVVKVVVESNTDPSLVDLKNLRDQLDRLRVLLHDHNSLKLDTEITLHRASDTLVYIFFANQSARIEAEVKGGTFADLAARTPGVTLELTDAGLQSLANWEVDRIGAPIFKRIEDKFPLIENAIEALGYPNLSIHEPHETRELNLSPGCPTATGFSILNGTRRVTLKFPLLPTGTDGSAPSCDFNVR